MSVPAHAPFDYQALLDSKSGKKGKPKDQNKEEAINKQSKPLKSSSQAPIKNANKISPNPTIENVFFLIITIAEQDIRYNPTLKLPMIASKALAL